MFNTDYSTNSRERIFSSAQLSAQIKNFIKISDDGNGKIEMKVILIAKRNYRNLYTKTDDGEGYRI